MAGDNNWNAHLPRLVDEQRALNGTVDKTGSGARGAARGPLARIRSGFRKSMATIRGPGAAT